MAQLNRSNTNATTARQTTGTDQNLAAAGKFRPALFAAGLMLIAVLAIYGCSKGTDKPAVMTANPSTATTSSTAPNPPTTPAPTVIQPQARKRPVQRKSHLATYTNPVYGISFRYPKSYILKEGDRATFSRADQEPVPMDFVKPGGMTLAAVELPGGPHAKPDLTSAFVNVSVNTNLTSAECTQFAFPDPSLPGIEPPSKVKVGVLEFEVTEDHSGQATNQAKYYHVFKNGACYEFGLGMKTASDAAAASTTPSVGEDVFRKLEKVLSTVRINPVALPALETPADSRSNPQPSAPASVPSPTSERI